jgi:hypothetical protein
MELTTISKELEKYNKLGFICIPLNGKRPFLKRWPELDHTPSRHIVFKNKNIGALCGIKSGITVLDIDIKDDGLKTWKKLISLYPKFETPYVKTNSGGYHYYFKYNSNLKSANRFTLNDKKIGWDVLNNARLVVLPPSDGYKWINSFNNTKLINMPEWLEYYLITMKTHN